VTTVARQHFTFADYVQLEETSKVKHEFLEGQVWAMAGGSPDHTAIAINVATLLNNGLRNRPCRVFGSDLRIRVKQTGLGTYPDVSVVCGRLELDPDDPQQQTVINPRVIVEVLSPTTEAYDRGEKLSHYKRIASLEEIVLVAYDERRLEVWHRDGDRWRLDVAHGTQSMTLRSVGCDLPLDEVYRDPLAEMT
jgi:Uma2 family endonuclease